MGTMGSPSEREDSNVHLPLPTSCLQIQRCIGTSALYLSVLTGDLAANVRSTTSEAPSRLERSGSFFWTGGADSLRTAQEITQVLGG